MLNSDLFRSVLTTFIARAPSVQAKRNYCLPATEYNRSGNFICLHYKLLVVHKCLFKGMNADCMCAATWIRSSSDLWRSQIKYAFLSFENFLIDISYIHPSINLSPFSPARSRYLYAVATRDVQSVGIDPARPSFSTSLLHPPARFTVPRRILFSPSYL